MVIVDTLPLCRAIINQAVKDYRYVCRHGDDLYTPGMTRRELENFFRSPLFSTMTGDLIDPDELMLMIRRGELRGRSVRHA